MINEAYIWFEGWAAVWAKSSKILLNENTLGLLGSAVGIDGVVVGIVLAPNVNGALVMELPAFLPSLSPAIVPKEKRDAVGAATEVVATDVVVVVEAVTAGVVAVVDPKLNVVLVVAEGVAAAALGVPNKKGVVLVVLLARLVVVGFSFNGLLVAIGALILNGDAVVAVVVFGASGGVPNENPVAAGVVVNTADEEANGDALVVAGVVGLSVLVAAVDANPNEGVVVAVETAVEVGTEDPNVKGAEGVIVVATGVLAGVPKLNPVSAVMLVVGVDDAAGDANVMPLVGVVAGGPGALKEIEEDWLPVEPKEGRAVKVLFTGFVPKLKEPLLVEAEVGILKVISEAARLRTSRSGTAKSNSDWPLFVLKGWFMAWEELKLKEVFVVGEAAGAAAGSPNTKGWEVVEPKLKPLEAGLAGVLLEPKPPGDAKGLPGWLPAKLKTKLGTLLPSVFFDLENFLLLSLLLIIHLNMDFICSQKIYYFTSLFNC